MEEYQYLDNYILKKYLPDKKQKGHVLHTITYPEHFKPISSIKFSYDGNTIAVCYRSGEVQEILTETGEILWSYPGKLDLTCVRFYPKAPYIFASDSLGRVFAYKRDGTNSVTQVKKDQYSMNTFVFGPLGKHVASGGKDASIRILDLNTGAVVRLFAASPSNRGETKYHKLSVTTVLYHPENGNILLSAGLDSCVKIWDLRTKFGLQNEIRGPYLYGEGLDVKGLTILTASYRPSNCLELWDMKTCKLFRTINPINESSYLFGQYLKVGKFHKAANGERMLLSGGSGIGSVNVVSLAENRIVYQFSSSHPRKVKALDNFGNKIAFGGVDNEILIGSY